VERIEVIMNSHNILLIGVRRQWNDYRIAWYRLSDISELHWDNLSGGVYAPAPQPFVHGYVWCDGKISGELAHSCRHGEGPHSIKVCLTKKGNEESWAEVLKIVGPKPGRCRRRKGGVGARHEGAVEAGVVPHRRSRSGPG
jgi:hypothetical protein